MRLAEVQDQFADWLAGADIDPAPLVDARSRRGLRVYRHAVGATLVACLCDTYERTHAWLGDEAFDEAAKAHTIAHPSRSWTLGDYGLGFDATLAERYRDDPEVAELAWLDWSLRRAFDGPDSPVLDPTGLAGVDWDNAVLHFSPTLAIREIETNAAAIWSALAAGDTPPAAARLEIPAALAVWRQGLSPRFRTIDPLEWTALESAMAGETFATVCGRLAEADSSTDPAQIAGAILSRWIGEGLLTGVEG